MEELAGLGRRACGCGVFPPVDGRPPAHAFFWEQIYMFLHENPCAITNRVVTFDDMESFFHLVAMASRARMETNAPGAERMAPRPTGMRATNGRTKGSTAGKLGLEDRSVSLGRAYEGEVVYLTDLGQREPHKRTRE